MPKTLKFKKVQQSMPVRLLVPSFVVCIIFPALILTLTLSHPHQSLVFPVMIMLTGVIVFTGVAWVRNKMWQDGTFALDQAAQQQENNRS